MRLALNNVKDGVEVYVGNGSWNEIFLHTPFLLQSMTVMSIFITVWEIVTRSLEIPTVQDLSFEVARCNESLELVQLSTWHVPVEDIS